MTSLPRVARAAWITILSVLVWVAPGDAGTEAPLRVAATIFPVADMVRNVGGDHVSVSVLLPAGASPHTFDPRPSQIRVLSEARLLFEIGAGLEPWADDLARAAGSRDLTVVQLSEGIELLGLDAPQELAADHDHPISHANPHVWLDPVHTISMVHRIAETLAEMDPAHASSYFQNASRYMEELVGLHEEIRRTTAEFASRRYVAFHPAWAYFARRYGLEPAGIIEESPGREPSPRHLQKILRAIRSYDIGAVFAEPQLSSKAADVIAAEAGVEVVVLDPLGGEGLEGRASYLALMRYNLSKMARALGRAREPSGG